MPEGSQSLRVLVAEPLAEEGIEALREHAEVDVRPGIERAELLDVIGDYDALIVRSATQVDAEVILKGKRLQVIGRAGIGTDNIDVEAATKKGVVVVNAPQSNILSAAEHTMALLLSLARQIPAADASTRSGGWERSRFTGVELHGKTLGILGLGRIGTLVAQRASAFGMRVMASDPYVSKARAQQMGIELAASLDELLSQADFITIHLPKTSETKAILGDEQFQKMKPGVRLVNAARGGLVDEEALFRALKDGRVAGAAMDVFDKEPPVDSPLLALETVIATPHLGASTQEAQTKAGTSIAEQVLLALRGEFAPYAVNIQGGAEYVEMLRPFIPLSEKLGRILTAIAGAGMSALDFEYHGTLAEQNTQILTLAGLKGAFMDVVHEPVTYVNAPLVAQTRGIELKETKTSVSKDFVNLVLLRAHTDEGRVAVAGSLVGKRDQERIVRVFDYEIDMQPDRYMCFLRYSDVPGVIGKVGSVLGTAGINIASMQVSRENIGGEALMGLTVDSPIPADALKGIGEAISARDVRFIDLGA